MRGGQSVAYFVELAASHGYTITIEQYSAFRVDNDRADDPLYDAAWSTPDGTGDHGNIYLFPHRPLARGGAVATWGNAQLECRICMYAPAHTVPMFQYT